MLILSERMEASIVLLCTILIFYRMFQVFQTQPLLLDNQKCVRYGKDGERPTSAPQGRDGVLQKPSSTRKEDELLRETRSNWLEEKARAHGLHRVLLVTLLIIAGLETYFLYGAYHWKIHSMIALVAIFTFFVQYYRTEFPETTYLCPSESFSNAEIERLAEEAKSNKELERKFASKLHPDKNRACVESAKQKFEYFQEKLKSS